MQKPFANSVSQALLYRFTELGYEFFDSPEDKSHIKRNDGYFVLPNTLEAHYKFLAERHENGGLLSVLNYNCISFLESEEVTPDKEFASIWELVEFCLEVENGA